MRDVPRVSILSLHFPPERSGNAPYAGALAAGLHAHEIPVAVVTGHPHYPEWAFHDGYGRWATTENIDGVSVARKKHYIPTTPHGVKRLLSELSFGVRTACSGWGKADVLVMVSPALFSTAIAMIRARLSPRRPATVVWVQDLYSLGITETGSGGAVLSRVMGWVESRTLRAASSVVVIHDRFAEYAVTQLGLDASRITVVPNWTHLDPVEPVNTVAFRAARGWDIDETIVLHAGNMGGKQGLENVVDAARLADQQDLRLRFVLLGDGNRRRALERYAEGVGCIEFVDSLDDSDFQSALSSADILLVNEKPGVTDMSLPSKLTSYFDSGRPVIAAIEPGGITAAEVRRSGGGVVVTSGHPQKLVDACLEMRNDPGASELYGKNGKQFRHDFLGEEQAIESYLHLIRGVAGRRRLAQGAARRR